METGGGPCSLVATPTRVDPLLPTLAVAEAEYIMKKSSFVLAAGVRIEAAALIQGRGFGGCVVRGSNTVASI